MAFGKTDEQKAAQEREKAARHAESQANHDRKAFLATPQGQATTAKEQGHGFFEIQLTVGSSQRDSTIFGGSNFAHSSTKTQTHAGTLSAIEAVGWHLEHVGYIFSITGESSRDKFLKSGEQTAVSGVTIGIYLFRKVETSSVA